MRCYRSDWVHQHMRAARCDLAECDLTLLHIRAKTPLISACMRDILLAVKVCHDNHVIHRDIKPENLLLTSDGHFKLADFGLATVAPGPGLHGFCGTPSYMAPELVGSRDRGDGTPRTPYDAKIDVWACGVIMYILLVGYQPYWNDDREELYNQILHYETDYPDDWYGALRLVLISHVSHVSHHAVSHVSCSAGTACPQTPAASCSRCSARTRPYA